MLLPSKTKKKKVKKKESSYEKLCVGLGRVLADVCGSHGACCCCGEAGVIEDSMDRSASDWALEMAKLRSVQPSSIKKRFGKNGPSEKQMEEYQSEVKEWNRKYRAATKMFKEAKKKEGW